MLPSDSQRPTWQQIDLDNLSWNLRSASAFVGSDVDVMAVVKANAYGHGAVECSRRLAKEGVRWLAVATCEEGIELREAGLSTPTLVLGGCWPGQEDSLIKLQLTPVIFTVDQARRLDEAARRFGVRLDVHVKFDTGMHRIGFRREDAAALGEQLARFGNLNIDGMMTHFAAADDLEETAFTLEQAATFATAVAAFRTCGHFPRYIDLANSPGSIAHPETRSNLVRLGGILYGLGEDVIPAGIPTPELRPVMSLYSRIAQIQTVRAGETIGYSRTHRLKRETKIATIPIGYHDGFRRALSNRGSAIVRGHRVSVVGRVSMDWVTLDVTDVAGIECGDVVTIIGVDSGERISAEDMARTAETLSYEITCGFDGRVRKEFV